MNTFISARSTTNRTENESNSSNMSWWNDKMKTKKDIHNEVTQKTWWPLTLLRKWYWTDMYVEKGFKLIIKIDRN